MTHIKRDRPQRNLGELAPGELRARLRARPRQGPHTGREALTDLAWEVADRQAFYRDFLANQDDLIWCQSACGAVLYANRAFQIAFGEVDGDGRGGLEPPRARAFGSGSRQDPTGPRNSVTGRVARSIEEYETATGWRWFEVARQAVADQPGMGPQTQCVARDVTERVCFQRQIEDARDAAHAANRAKSRFLAAMSHEIRTPMNGILGMTALLADTLLQPEQQTYLNAIDRSGRSLLTLIDEILDFSKIEAGRLDLANQPIVLEDCMQSVVDLLSPRARSKSVALAWAIDPAVPLRVLGDEVRLRQILTNLIGNAVKFTDKGGVLITIEGDRRGLPRNDGRGDRQAAAQTTLIISVLDTGVGISPAALGRLFAEFEQGDETQARRHGGTGLGLAITRRLARAMGGDVFARSKPGEGSTFTALLRFKPTIDLKPAHETLLQDSGHDSPHVLLVMPPGVELLAHRLTLQGAGLPAAETTAAAALKIIAMARAEDAPFTAIVVDSSYGSAMAATLLAAARAAHRDVRGVVVHDPSQRGQIDAYRTLGFEAFLQRPLRPRTLIEQILPRGIEPTRMLALDMSEMPPAIVKHGTLHILLVEDNDINALLAQTMLEKSGYGVRRVKNGLAAVAAMDHHMAGSVTFDLVLMDVHMPVMDGLEAARTIHRNFSTAHHQARCPPIVALTANAFDEDRRQCIEAGMSDYLAKPFDRAALQAVLTRVQARIPHVSVSASG